jgi:cbb3-type cytochrome oxidase subunit 3
MLYKSASLGMAGCCGGGDTQNCGWASACVNYQNYVGGNCGTNCILNTLIRKCTNVASPYCVTWTYPSDGIADYGCDDTSTNTIYTIRQTAKDTAGGTTSTRLPTAAAGAVNIPTGSSSNTTNHKVAKKLAIGAIIGIVVAVLAIFFFVAVGVFMFMKKKKKQKQIAANAQIVADMQANGPQASYQQPPPPPQQMQHPTPMQNQSSQPTGNGYFAPPNQQPGEQKFNPHNSVHEYAMTPISNPTTPAPMYAQPYGSPAPPMPQQYTAQYQAPANGAHEIPSPMTPQQHTGQYQPPTNGTPSPMQQQYTGQYQPPANGARDTVSPQHTGQYQPPANGAHEVASPVLQQQTGQHQSPANGAHEVASPDMAPPQKQQQYQGQNVRAHGVDAQGKTGPGPVYEMGGR